MARTYLASVANVDGFVNKDERLIHALSARTLTESTLGFTSTMEEVRAGQGGKIYGRFNHSTGMTVTLTDAMFDINYIKYQIGAEDAEGGNSIIYNDPKQFKGSEIKDGINLSEVPAAFGQACGLDDIAVWFRPVGCKADVGNEITIINGQGGVTITGNAIAIDSTEKGAATKAMFMDDNTYCVSYLAVSSSAQMYKILAEFKPAEMVLIMSASLYAGDANNPGAGSKYGSFVVKIPRFQLDGQFDLSMAMTSAATMSLAGTALAVDDGTCDGQGLYAEMVIHKDASAKPEEFSAIIIDAESDLKVGAVPEVFGTKHDGSIVRLANSDLVFTPALATNGTYAAAGQQTVKFGETLTHTATVEAG